MEDTLAFYGGAVKALGGGRLEGYGVLHSTVVDPDLQEEFFTKGTEYMVEIGDRKPILYRHGSHPQLKSRILGKASITHVDDVGVFFEGELNLRDNYEKAIYKLAEMGKLGFSTGSMSHLVEKEVKEHNGKQASEIKVWPIGELSLTPTPVESRTSVFVKELGVEDTHELDDVVKSLNEEDEPEVEFSLDGLPGLKSLCESVSPANLTMSEHSNVADAALKELVTHGTIFVDAFKGYRVRADRLVEFRFKKDGGSISKTKEESLKGWKDGLAKLRMDVESVESDIEGTLKLSHIARSEVDAAEKHAKFLMQQLANLNSVVRREENSDA